MFEYTTEIIDNLEKSISVERLGTYLSETEGNRKEALELYLKNAKISADFYLPLQSLEITLRNKLHTVLCEHFKREDWYDLPILNERGQKNVRDAKRAVKRLHQEVNPPHVVAELSFGFWLSLLNKKYHQNLWIPSLNKAFPNAKMKRADILRDLDHLRTFRNRIAHHEPVFKRHLKQDLDTTLTAISWMCRDTAEWTTKNCSKET
jgi:hypothetical protein